MATRADIRAEARDRADQNDSDFPTDAQYNTAINRGATRAFVDMVSAGWAANLATTTIVANGSTQTYSFGGSDLVVGSTLVYTDIGGQTFELKRVNPGAVPQLRSQQATGQFSEYYEVRHDINTGPVVEFFPKIAGTYYVEYLPGFNGFANDSAVWRGPYGSDELLVLYAARFGVLKEGRTTDGEMLRKEYNDRLYELKQNASTFDLRNAASIREVLPMDRRRAFDYFAIGPHHEDF